MESFAHEPDELDEGRLLAAKLCADPRPDVIAAALASETAADNSASRDEPKRSRPAEPLDGDGRANARPS
jgi:hypothetical protein